jgi:hypothetical protein
MPFQELGVPQKGATDPLEVRHGASLPITIYHDLLALIKKSGLFIILALVIYLISQSIFLTEAGYIYHYQALIWRKIYVYDQPGIHLKVPFFSRLTRYDKAWTVNFGISYGGHQIRRKGPIEVTLADTYTAKIPATFRYTLPSDEKYIKDIHSEFKTFDELIDSLLIKTARDVVVNTATQYTGEEFFLGGLNQFKAALTDQLRNGIYKTERKQVEFEQMDIAPIGLGQEESTQLQKINTLIWKTVPVRDPKTGKKVRIDNPLDKYGILVTQVTLGDPIAEPQLERLLAEKKRLVGERIKAVQEQETAKEQAKMVQLQVEVERTRSKQEALKRKDLAIIAKQLEVEEAEKQAEKEIIEYEKAKRLAEIKKAEELSIAKMEQDIERANQKKLLIAAEEKQNIEKTDKETELVIAQKEREIQKAKFEAAQFEAQAILEKGIAEAKVLHATYEARIPELYLAEIQREIANVIYPNLKGVHVTMPHNIVNLGAQDNKLQTNLDVLSSFATLGVMEGLEKKALETEAAK